MVDVSLYKSKNQGNIPDNSRSIFQNLNFVVKLVSVYLLQSTLQRKGCQRNFSEHILPPAHIARNKKQQISTETRLLQQKEKLIATENTFQTKSLQIVRSGTSLNLLCNTTRPLWASKKVSLPSSVFHAREVFTKKAFFELYQLQVVRNLTDDQK